MPVQHRRNGKSLAEAIGLMAVVAGLVFVGMELRQNNRLAQAAAYQEIGFATAANWIALSEDPTFNRIYLRHFFADSSWWAAQRPEDVERLASLWVGALRQYETIYLQVELGLLDDVALQRLGWADTRGVPALRHLWPLVALGLDAEFSAWLTSDWSDVPAVRGPAALPALDVGSESGG